MGYTYTRVNGRYILDCDACGRTGNVRRRPCPVKAASGLPWCPAVALCDGCYAQDRFTGEWSQHHARCAEYASASA